MAQTKKQTDNDGYAAEPDKLAGMGQMTDGGRRTDDQNSDGDRDTNNNNKKKKTDNFEKTCLDTPDTDRTHATKNRPAGHK